MTTATYRSQAWEAQEQGEYATAAMLYRKALEAYPTTGAMAQADRANLQQRIKFNESMSAPVNG